MRILLANKYWRPLGGVEEHAFTVKRFLEDAGHEVIPFSTHHPDNLESPYEKYFVRDVDFRDGSAKSRARSVGRATFGVETVRQLRRLLADEHIDAAHVLHTYHQMGMTLLLELRRQNVPTILSLHDYKISCPSYRYFSDRTGKICTKCLDHKSGYLWAPAVERCWDGSALAGASLTLEASFNRAIGSYTRGPGSVIVLNDLQNRSVVAAGVDPTKIHHVPHFLDLPDNEAVDRERHVLYVGRLVPEKGVDTLIRACGRAGLPLRIAGDGRDRAQLEDLASQLSVDVTFLGSLPQPQVHGAMRRAGALAVPSLWHEVSPLVVLEGIANNCPVVGTRTGGIPDLIGEGRGVLVEPGDEVELANGLSRVIDQPEVGAGFARAARDYAAAQWTRDRWARNLETAYATAGADLRL